MAHPHNSVLFALCIFTIFCRATCLMKSPALMRIPFHGPIGCQYADQALTNRADVLARRWTVHCSFDHICILY